MATKHLEYTTEIITDVTEQIFDSKIVHLISLAIDTWWVFEAFTVAVTISFDK
jgi:hypothetical protein